MSIVLLAIVGFAFLLSFSALFSASETAFFSLTQVELNEMDPEGRVRRLLRNPDRLLVTILFGNTIVNTAAGALGALVALHVSRVFGFPEGAAIALEVGAVTLVVLVFGEVAPKMFAMQRNKALARRSAGALSVLMSAAGPIVHLLTRLSDEGARRGRRRRAPLRDGGGASDDRRPERATRHARRGRARHDRQRHGVRRDPGARDDGAARRHGVPRGHGDGRRRHRAGPRTRLLEASRVPRGHRSRHRHPVREGPPAVRSGTRRRAAASRTFPGRRSSLRRTRRPASS